MRLDSGTAPLEELTHGTCVQPIQKEGAKEAHSRADDLAWKVLVTQSYEAQYRND